MQASFDIDKARNKIRDVAEKEASSKNQNSNYYRDVDQDNLKVVPSETFEFAAVLQNEEFQDLDLQPLSLVSVTPLESPVESEPDNESSIKQTNTPTSPPPAPGSDKVVLDPPQMRRILYLATTPSGTTPAFSKTQANLDGNGLRYGIGRFTQKSGDLGKLLNLFLQRDAQSFNSIFGPDEQFPNANVNELLRVCNANEDECSHLDQHPRMVPVSGKHLWESEWIKRFKSAANYTPFQDMQYRLAAEIFLLPNLSFARNLGLATEKGLAILCERSINFGVMNAREFIINACGPINTIALRHAALEYIAKEPNQSSLIEFQQRLGIKETLGQFGPLTHATLVALLRDSDNSPIQIPSTDMLIDRIAKAAQQSELPGLVEQLRDNSNLSSVAISDKDPILE